MTTKVPARMVASDVASLANLTTVVNALLPVGSILPFAGASAPANVTVAGVTLEFALCRGQAVSRTTYAALFTALGTAFGAGDGSTTFNLPDYRGRVILGKDDMGGSAANRVTNAISGITGTLLGGAGGDERMHGHTHVVTDPGHTHLISPPSASDVTSSGSTATGAGGAETVTPYSSGSATTGITLGTEGAGASQNMPPAQVANVLIRLR